MEEEKRSYRWLWAVIPAVVAAIALALAINFFWPTRTADLPNHVVNISGNIQSAEPVDELVEATWSMRDQELIDQVLEEPDQWQGYELTVRLTNKSTSSSEKLEMVDWFVNPGHRFVKTEDGYQYEDLPDEPMLIVGPCHGDSSGPLDKGTSDYNVRLVVNKAGKTAEEVEEYVNNMTVDVQTTLVYRDKEVDYVTTPITWKK